ncbi:MAG: glutamate racemase [Bacillota bacterium]
MTVTNEQLINAHKAIGVIDSGVGGLTVVNEMSRRLPHESIVYFGDTARMPYGSRPNEEVRRFVFEIIDFLKHQEVKLIVIACNSATAAGLSYYQQVCEQPVVGVIEPGVRAALQHTNNRRIGVIGTAGTIGSGEYEKALQKHNGSLHIVSKACPMFVLLVENNLVDTPEARKVAQEYLKPMGRENIDTLILGCTHYPLMIGLIQGVMGSSVKLINSAEEIVTEVDNILESSEQKNPLNSNNPRYRFFVSGDPRPFEEVSLKLLEQEIKAYQVRL